MTHDEAVRQHVVNLLTSRHAHPAFDGVIKDWPASLYGAGVPEVPYTGWQLLEHIRIAQWDILEFSRDAGHVSPRWPDGYWPDGAAPPDDQAWHRSVAAFRNDMQAMITLVADPATDLYAPIPHGDGQTILREALLVADHNAYHLGQMVMLRRLLGAWAG